MACSVAMSLSRGGFLALLAGCLVCLLIQLVQSPGSARPALLGVIVAGSALLVSWFGFDTVSDRLGTLLKGDAYRESRAPVWSELMPLTRNFAVWGTGYGTMQYVSPLYRDPAQDPDAVVEHAHNEYLEALIEGGLPRLALTLTGIALAYVLAFRALRRSLGQSAEGLVLGCLLALTTLVVHSIGEFGIHIPAIAILATVLIAQLSALGGPEASRAAQHSSAAADRDLRVWGLAPLLGAAGLAIVALLLYTRGWRAYEADASAWRRKMRARRRKSARKRSPGSRPPWDGSRQTLPCNSSWPKPSSTTTERAGPGWRRRTGSGMPQNFGWR